MGITPFDFDDPAQLAAATAIWNAACGADFAISERAMRYNTRQNAGGVAAGMLADVDGAPAGFVIASALPGAAGVTSPGHGWINAVAVDPRYQCRGAGRALLHWAEGWLREQGCTRAALGSSLRTFAPGLPVSLAANSGPFFAAHGYGGRAHSDRSWDLAHDLRGYASRYAQRTLTGAPRAAVARPGDEGALLDYLRREFPGRWRYEAEEHLAEGGAIEDFVLLWTGDEVNGSTQVTFEDSVRVLDRLFPQRLPRPWGQLGSIGVSAAQRGKGYGGLLLDAGLCYLRDRGVAGCVIDWTGLLDFYGKFGFTPYNEHLMWGKDLAQDGGAT
jgi:GNAT superfamily N-acetyltransferase